MNNIFTIQCCLEETLSCQYPHIGSREEKYLM